MTPTDPDKNPPPLPSPACPIILGITGHRHFLSGDSEKKTADEAAIKARFELVLAAFSSAPASGSKEVRKMREDLGFPTGHIESGLPLDTPVWILCPMAAGADIFAALTAKEFYAKEQQRCREDNRDPREIRFIAPLATPWKARLLDKTTVGNPYTCKLEAFEKLRGAKVPTDCPGGSIYREFVLPLGGRMCLQNNTTFPKTPHQFTTGHGPDAPPTQLDPLRWDELDSQQLETLLAYTGNPQDGNAHQQYKAGALYVSLYSHVVIAFWDGVVRVDSAGSDAAVQVKIKGPAPGDISHRPIFSWADSGPVVQILTNNPDRTTVDKAAEPAAESHQIESALQLPKDNAKVGAKVGDHVVIHPDDCSRDELSSTKSAAAALKQRNREGRYIFARIFRATFRFNADIKKSPALDQNFEPRLKQPPPTRSLQQIYQIASQVSQRSVDLKNQTMRWFFALFILVGLGAASFDVYAHYYADTSGGHPEHYRWVLVSFLCCVVIAAAVYYFLLHRPGLEARYLEYRALAEAGRIQLVWMAAGIPQSVPLHYLQRHRGSFDWIRNTVSAWCFPYEQGQREFGELDRPAKIARLRNLVDDWMVNQSKYFADTSAREHRAHHTLHILGIATALVGVCAALFAVARNWHLLPFTSDAWAAAVLAAGWLSGIFALAQSLPSNSKEHRPGNTERRGKKSAILVLGLIAVAAPFFAGLLHQPHDLAHSNPSAIDPSGICAKWVWDCILSFLVVGLLGFALIHAAPEISKAHTALPYIPFAIAALGFLVFGIGSMVTPPEYQAAPVDLHASHPPTIPYILLIGLPILFGALMIAWGEKQLHSEHANRFHTTGELFRLTGNRLKQLLDQAGQEQKKAATANKANNTADSTEHAVLCDQQIAAAQDVLFELGKEALTENAEWLLLHRARPLEFPVA